MLFIFIESSADPQLKNRKPVLACHERIATDGNVCPTGLGADKIAQAGVSAHLFLWISPSEPRADSGEWFAAAKIVQNEVGANR
jgi:hypothetical protein